MMNRWTALILGILCTFGLNSWAEETPSAAAVNAATSTEAPLPRELFTAPSVVSRSESETGSDPWKGMPRLQRYTSGLLMGMGIYDGNAGVAVVGNFGLKLINDGILPDLNDQVYLETELGALTFEGAALFMYGAHMRWDFHRNTTWTFYALGGLGGTITGEALGNSWRLYPRLGVGFVWNMFKSFAWRGQVSQDLMALGATFYY